MDVMLGAVRSGHRCCRNAFPEFTESMAILFEASDVGERKIVSVVRSQ